jgi:hypothetical protein
MANGTRALRFIKSLMPKQGPTGEQTLWTVGIAIIFVVLLGVLTLIGLPFKTTAWDWLNLLIIPAVIAVVGTVGGAWFTRQRAQETSLQAYLDKMSELLIDKGLHEKDNPYDATRVTARSRTLAVLTQLDEDRKKNILRFLYEAQLINRWKKKLKPDDATEFKPRIVGLDGADLKTANLRYLTLEEAALDGALLENADLRDAKLSKIDLGGAYLSGADLTRADLSGASLVNAHLQRKDDPNLSGANLKDTNVTDEQLALCESLEGATMPNG